MSTVYVINKSGHDFSSASKFGDIVYLSRGMLDAFRVTKIYRLFVRALDKSDREDMLLVSGLPIMIGIASSIMARKHGVVNWLLWDPREERYKKRTLMVDELLSSKEVSGEA